MIQFINNAGKLLISIVYDAEIQLLPLAFGLVETKSFEDCGWFMHWLWRNVIDFIFMCVIIDREKSIKNVSRQDDLGWTKEDENQCVHYFCATHIAENMKRNL